MDKSGRHNETMDLFACREPMPDNVPRDVAALFEQLALGLIRDGWERYSARAILHRIRWHMSVEKKDREFKANNNWTPELSRWFMKKYPAYGAFFELRERKKNNDD